VTAYRWFLEGKLPVPASRAGHLIGWRWWRMRPELMTAWCQTWRRSWRRCVHVGVGTGL